MPRIGTWNTEWAKLGTARGNRVSAALAEPDCDVLCATEGYAEILPSGGYVIDAGPDWGYRLTEGRRKVLLWSKRPWSVVDPAGSEELPSGRLVAGVTQTGLGSLTVIGVCIPWRDAHVRTGRKDRDPWQDHESWLSGFETLPYRRATERTVVLGDFNQRIPRRWQPKRVYEALLRAFDGLTVATTGESSGAPGRSIDHIAHTYELAPFGHIGLWPKRSARDETLSDHFGVWADFVLSSTGTETT